jgi:hypothetical protein
MTAVLNGKSAKVDINAKVSGFLKVNAVSNRFIGHRQIAKDDP